MKKVFLSFLTVILFVSVGIAQTSSAKTKAVKSSTLTPVVMSTADRAAAAKELFEGEQAFMDNLKITDPATYIAYLEDRLEIKKLQNKVLSSVEKAELKSKLNIIETKYGLK